MALLGKRARPVRADPRLLAAAALAVCLQSDPAGCAGAPGNGDSLPLEDAVKAAYIYKFAPFVTWPLQAAGAAGAPFNICSIGADRVTALMPQVTEGQRIDDQPIRVRALGEGEAPSDCRILYVAGPNPSEAILESVRGKPILTVTSVPGAHSVVQLATVAHHVRFDIDAKLASEDGLAISSKLLSLARAVKTEAQP